MESNYKNHYKAIGFVEEILGLEVNHARVRVLGLYDEQEKFKKVSDLQASQIIQSEGMVFWRDYHKYNNEIKLGDFITFSCQYSEGETRADKYYVVRPVKKHKIKIYQGDSSIIKDEKIFNFCELNKEFGDKDIDGNFYILIDNNLYGMIRINNRNEVESQSGKTINAWYNIENEILSYNGKSAIVSDSLRYRDEELDFMDNRQLVEWLKERVKELNGDFFKKLEVLNWRGEFRAIFEKLNQSSVEIDRMRIKKISKFLNNWDLTIEEVNFLANTNKTFAEDFRSAIEKHKELLKQNYEFELEALKEQIVLEKKHGDTHQQELKSEIENLMNHLAQLKDQESTILKGLEHIQNNKSRLITEFQFLLDIKKDSTYLDNREVKGFVIEEIACPYNEDFIINNKSDFVKRLKCNLHNANIDKKIARRYIDLFLLYDCILLPNPSYAIPLVEAIGNTKFIFQQAEANWITFEQLWINGLNDLWASCFRNPNTVHIFILEDINLASIECYGRPLMDVMRGIRKQIPYGKMPKPKNLKILGTVLPHNSPRIGLPIFEETYKNWGCIGFGAPLFAADSEIPPHIDGYVTADSLENMKIANDIDLEELRSDIAREFELVVSL
ncbi:MULTISPECIES: hypothetical protein [Niastella]|uniref:Uncharacterized protein n=1 Tax=Niastella soli TaxID=2821487 RepID=A0ABS3Z3V2_9BACT|nr:hypothetical protein [Niastella soli]MBO9204855.1 hypothetical protein [Niastella soli]